MKDIVNMLSWNPTILFILGMITLGVVLYFIYIDQEIIACLFTPIVAFVQYRLFLISNGNF
jgi:hypothetical protein